ncbi:hypothetical protein OG239_42530 (plasmid) [Streptomyces sp. NBC_00868]|nr:hypothetical protein OG239_42530 [Streptomyces sp. NBC_00868]
MSNPRSQPPSGRDRSESLGPRGKEYTKAYALLEKALANANRAGAATFVMRGREYLVALKADDDLGILTVHTLHWADEIRDPRKEIPDLPGTTKASGQEMNMAEQLISALATDWDPEAFRDTFQERVAALMEAKKAGESVEKAEPPAKATGAVDLMEPYAPASSEHVAPRTPARKPPPQPVRRGRRPPPRKSASRPRASRFSR